MACKIWGGSPVSVMSATSLQKSPIIFSGTWRKITGYNLVIKKRKTEEKTVEHFRILQVYVSVEKLADSSKKVWAGLGAPFLSGLVRTSFAVLQCLHIYIRPYNMLHWYVPSDHIPSLI